MTLPPGVDPSKTSFSAAGPSVGLISEEDLLDIGRRAAGLFELLGARPAAPTPEPRPDTGILAAWSQAFSPGDPQALKRRLEWDGLDEASALAAASAPAAAEGTPAWTAWLPRFLDEAARCGRELDARGSLAGISELSPSPEPPFVEVWIPFLRSARDALARAAREPLAGVSRGALAAFERRLLRELSLYGELALYEGFQQFLQARPAGAGDRYALFVRALLDGELASLFTRFPVLARQLARLVSTWVDSTAELLERLERDRPALAQLLGVGDLGELTGAEAGLSDRHHGGRRVAVLRFASGLGAVYKPREVGLESGLQSLLAWAASRGLAHGPRPLRVLEREGYGWVELVEEAPFESRAQVEEYFRRAGSLLCFAHVLRGGDLHNENIIATRDGPALIDGEALLQPAPRHEAEDEGVGPGAESEGRASRIRGSCLSTGLVTLMQLDAKGVAYDIGGLREGGPRAAFVARRLWRRLRSGALHFVRKDTVTPSVSNRVLLDGVLQRPEDFSGELAFGFAETYRFLLGHRSEILEPGGPLARFAGRGTRVLFRPSDQYGALLYVLAAPRHQRLGVERSLALESLNRVFSRESARPRLWPLVADERRSLEELDIPRFTLPTTDTVVGSGSGERVEGHFVQSGLAAARRRLETMCDEDLDGQLALLEAALAGAVDHAELAAAAAGAVEETASRPEAGDLVRAAERLGTEILAKGTRGEGGGLSWMGTGHRYDLYDGQPGIALFLAALGAVTGEKRWAEAARAAVEPLRRALREDGALLGRWPGIGACNGLGSAVYALASMGRLLGDGSSTELARVVARHIVPDRIESDARLDVAGGAAGAILALLALHQEIRESWTLDRAAACGRRLVSTQLETGPRSAGWPAPDGCVRAGFAHGAAGIAYALARLFVLTRDPDLLEAARRAHRHERGLFSSAGRNWPLLRAHGGTAVLTAWCHGAPGVGLARALSLDALEDDEVLGEIRVAMETTAQARPVRFDHLCCGNLGRSDALLTVGRRLDDAALIASAESTAAHVAERARAQGRLGVRTVGFENGVFRPGFFQGLSGIGYQLLRTAAPSRLPSVLGFEVGARA